jgi:hypothetical protein
VEYVPDKAGWQRQEEEEEEEEAGADSRPPA